MYCHRATSTATALYEVFVLPTVPRYAVPRVRLDRTQPQVWTRPFSQQSRLRAKTHAPEQRAQKWDNEIKARRIHLVDRDSGRLHGEANEGEPTIYTRYDIMKNLDTKTHRLVQLSPDEPDNPDFIPVCRVVAKKEEYDREKQRKQQQKEQKKAQAISGEKAMKTVELNWAIDGNDLGHRLGKMKEFLEEGRRVEVVLASKKRGRKATQEECESVLKQIRDVAESVPGTKEREEMKGKLGGFATMVLQGRPFKAVGGAGGGKEETAQEGG